MFSHQERSRDSRGLSLTVCLLTAAFLNGCSGPDTSSPVPTGTNGPIATITVATSTGTFSSIFSPTNLNVNVFYGIRYAAPPEGSLRWQPPTPPTRPSGTVLAATPGNACPQPGSTGSPQSEDCLFLNVWVPSNVTASAKLPVYFYIHGGSLVSGAGSVWDPSAMVAQSNIIVVTINYRLGALGWLVEPGLIATTANTSQNVGDGGNYGLMDQQYAMQWVQKNIAAFGGDPTKVTIGGESAGGLSVTSNLTSTNTAKGLFRGAIIESGAYMLHSVLSQTNYEATFGPGFDSALGCTQPNDAACLRAATVSQILAAQSATFGGNGIGPDFDNKMLPNSLISAFTNGAFFQVPVLQGTNLNEGRLFEPGFYPSPHGATAAQIAAAGGPANFDLSNANAFCASGGTNQVCTYPQEIDGFLDLLGFPSFVLTPTFGSAIADLYPLATFPDPYLASNAPSSDEGLSQIFTDLVFACNALDSNKAISQFVTVYGYEFNDPNDPPAEGSNTAINPPNDVDGFSTGSEHAGELPFIFNVTGATYVLSTNEQKLSTEMQTYWGNFIVSLNPNTPISSGVPTWTAFTNAATTVQNLVPGPANPVPFTNFATSHFCSTWEPFIEAE
jgi:para-nitrobenzyl esterase